MIDSDGGYKRAIVDHIPLIWIEPKQSINKDLVIWLPGFSGSKEAVIPQLQALAEAGYYALSFDPYQHGDRKMESVEELGARIWGNIRRHFWPILTLTAEEFPRVIDYAIEHLGITGKVMAGGISMGGDIVVAACGIDPRISAAAVCVATPDWLRPGSHEPPGQADRFAQNCYDRRNPLTHLERYSHRPAISFQCGELDTQVPPSGAEQFAAELLAGAYKESPERIEVYKHPLVPHAFPEQMMVNAIKWFQLH